MARSEPPATSARTLSPGGAAMLRSGLLSIAPRLVAQARATAEANAAELSDLTARLASSKSKLGALYATPPAFLFATADGLTPAGDALTAWVAEAPLHAIDLVVPEAVAKLSAAKMDLPPLQELEAAWSAAGSGERFASAAHELGKRMAGLKNPARVEAEVALAEAYAALALALPSRPRQAVVLEDEDGRYLSPDVTWREEAPLPDEARVAALTKAFEAARSGQLKAHLDGLVPLHPQYRALVEAARRYGALCREGGWATLEAPKDAKVGRTAEALRPLQERLAKEGFWAGLNDGTWSADFEQALVRVRTARRLKEKPEYDKALVEALNVPCETRLRALTLNIRRWRYSAWNGESESVQVNLAAQMMRYFRENTLVMKQRTVVGSDKSFFSKTENRRIYPNASPILHDTIDTIIVNPDWNVPPRIARNEIDVEVAKDPTYLETKGFRVVPTAAGNLYVQAPGPGNALGRIKILFPNSESVYLHDTPGRNAFKLPVRALSHGCVRLQNAMDVGVELLRSDRAKRGEVLDEKRTRALAGPKPWPFKLDHPIPVFLEYYTASVDEDGVTWFHPDIYGYDAETFGAQK